MLSSTLVCKQSNEFSRAACEQHELHQQNLTPAGYLRDLTRKSDFSFSFFLPRCNHHLIWPYQLQKLGFAETQGRISPSSITRSNPWTPENDCRGPPTMAASSEHPLGSPLPPWRACPALCSEGLQIPTWRDPSLLGTVTTLACARLVPRRFLLLLPGCCSWLRLFAFSKHRGRCWRAVSRLPGEKI